MGFADIFKNVATTATSLFAEEQGPITFRQMLASSNYDTTTGINTPVYKDYSVLAMFVGLDDKELMDVSNRAEHSKCLISGGLLSVEPQKNDVVLNQQNIEFIVVSVKKTPYDALYTLYIKELNKT